MEVNLKQDLLGAKKNDILKLDIMIQKSHFAMDCGAQKILDKGRVSKYNKSLATLEKK